MPVYIIVFKATAFAEEIAADFPGLSKEQVLEALNYAAETLEETRLANLGEK
jgi:uncharacterized protein (DUF433 family)